MSDVGYKPTNYRTAPEYRQLTATLSKTNQERVILYNRLNFVVYSQYLSWDFSFFVTLGCLDSWRERSVSSVLM